MNTQLKFLTWLVLALGAHSLIAQPVTTPSGSSPRTLDPRERVSPHDGWRFQKDDPPGNAVSRLYDTIPT